MTIVLATLGCGGSHQLDTARVSGQVTLDGEPLTSGYVMALPTKGRMARAPIQPDGSFTFGTYSDSDGVQIGTHAVTVTPVPPDEGSSRPKKQAKPIPRKYAQARGSGLTITVESGGSDSYKIELQSGE